MSEKRKVPDLRFPGFSNHLLVQKQFREVVESNIYGPRFNANDYYPNGNVKTIRGTDVDRNGSFKYQQIPTAKLDGKLVNTHMLRQGDLVMITTADCGLTGVFEEQELPHISSAYGVRIRLNTKGEPHFFKYFFQTRIAKAQIDSFIRKATVSNLPGSDILKIKVYLPSLPEQQKIAEFMTAVDKRIELLQAKKEKLEAYKKGVMQQIFSQKLRFKADDGSDFPDWEEMKLGEVAKIYDGTHQTPKYVDEGIPFFSVEHVTANQFTKTKFITEKVFNAENKRVKLEKGDILMTRIGSIGVAKLIDWEVKASFYVSLALLKVSPKLNSSFLTYFIASDLFQRELWKRTIHVAFPQKINLGEIGECEVLIPDIPEQEKIASFLTSLDSSIETLEKQINQTQTWKKGLLQKMFV